jgi:hypothetical protein
VPWITATSVQIASCSKVHHRDRADLLGTACNAFIDNIRYAQRAPGI